MPTTPTSRELARRLIERQTPAGNAAEPGVAAAHAACERVYLELQRWVGGVGCAALFERARTEARSAHDVLAGIAIRSDSAPHVDGVAGCVQSAGPDAAAAGLEAMLTALLELLGRFIGEDMVNSLLDRNVSEAIERSRDRLEEGMR